MKYGELEHDIIMWAEEHAVLTIKKYFDTLENAVWYKEHGHSYAYETHIKKAESYANRLRSRYYKYHS